MTYTQMTFESLDSATIKKEIPTISEALKLRERIDEERTFARFDAGEILATLIGFANPRQNALKLADDLLDSFGSLKGVLEARPEQLRSIKGVGSKTASLIASIIPLVQVWNKEAMNERDKIKNMRECEKYCLSLLAGMRTETFYVICLDAQCRILGTRKISEGSLNEVSAYPRIVMETALNYNAHAVIFCHNHPGGTCAPSQEDIASTLQLQRLLNGVGILVYDHIIVADGKTYSMIEHGDINYRPKAI